MKAVREPVDVASVSPPRRARVDVTLTIGDVLIAIAGLVFGVLAAFVLGIATGAIPFRC